jgi:hypothetical protein
MRFFEKMNSLRLKDLGGVLPGGNIQPRHPRRRARRWRWVWLVPAALGISAGGAAGAFFGSRPAGAGRSP